MTPLKPNGAEVASCDIIEFDKFDSFEVCWAGPQPFKDGFCFGSEDGRLLYTDEMGAVLNPPTQASASGEAINGVAVVGRCLAVSTRADITFWTEISPTEKKAARAVVSAGSHGITASPSGSFFAPLGLAGLMKVKPTDELLKAGIMSPKSKNPAYFYRTILLRDSMGHETIVNAIRLSGIGVYQFTVDSGEADTRKITYPDLDVVDVCPLNPGGNSLAAAAVGNDGTLVLFRNVLTDKKPVTFKFNSIQGKAYRILSCRGHLFVLTSVALYIIANVAGRVLRGESMRGVTAPILSVPMEAVDANLYRDKFLLIVLAENKVIRIDLALMETIIPESLKYGDVTQFTPMSLDPNWEDHEEHGVEQDLREVGVG